jgi:threonyl-tRNA synthetase
VCTAPELREQIELIPLSGNYKFLELCYDHISKNLLCLTHNLLLDNLQEYEARIEAAEERNHRILGESQKLFFFSPLRYLSVFD